MSSPRSEEGSYTSEDLNFIDAVEENVSTTNRKRNREDNDDELPAPTRIRTASPSPPTDPLPQKENDVYEMDPKLLDCLGPVVTAESDADDSGNPLMEPVLNKDGTPRLNKDGSPQNEKKKSSFNFVRRYICLTYPQCPPFF